MYENDLMEWVDAVVFQHLSAVQPFTAYTITQGLRAIGIYYPHDIVRFRVHALFHSGQMGGVYARTLCDVGGARGLAWVYHHCENSPHRFASHLRYRASPPKEYSSFGD